MDNRVLLAIVLSIGALILFQYLYLQYLAPKPPQGSINQTLNQTAQETNLLLANLWQA